MSRILVTGCAGFIGSHLTEALLASGHEVTGIDNFSSFYPKEVKLGNMTSFEKHPNFKFLEIDIRNKEALHASVTSTIDIVAHLAAKAGVRPSIKDPEAYIDVNVKGSNNVLELMRKVGCKKLFFASSSSIYGNQKEIPFKENSSGLSPISPYAFTKRACELMNYTYHHLYEFDVINARFFTVYGPRQRPDLAIHKFVNMIDESTAIPMFGDGTTSRDYTYIDDIIQGIIKSIALLDKKSGLFETFNLGNNHPVSLMNLVQLIFEAMGKSTPINHLPMQEGDVDVTFADISRAKELIDYQPTTSMKEGLKKFIDWHRS